VSAGNGEVDAVDASETVDVASVVVAVKAETTPVRKVAIITTLIRTTLAAEKAIVWVFIVANNFLIKASRRNPDWHSGEEVYELSFHKSCR
jgi:hypothetical protein